VIACFPQDIVLDDRLGEDHVGLCILYCLTIVSILVTICKWLLIQTILDGYLFIKHFITFHETHILDVDDVGVVGVKGEKNPFIRRNKI
jgi:hypothetical protein